MEIIFLSEFGQWVIRFILNFEVKFFKINPSIYNLYLELTL